MRRAGTALFLAAVCAACGSSHATPRPLHVGHAYLGLDCGKALSCPRLGIAVWLTTPERRVTVTLHDRRVPLVTRRTHEYRRYWQGFVRDRFAERLVGAGNRALRLTVEAIDRDGTIRRTTLVSPVNPGWG